MTQTSNKVAADTLTKRSLAKLTPFRASASNVFLVRIIAVVSPSVKIISTYSRCSGKAYGTSRTFVPPGIPVISSTSPAAIKPELQPQRWFYNARVVCICHKITRKGILKICISLKHLLRNGNSSSPS